MVIQSEHYQAPGRAQREACLRWAFFICPYKFFIQLAMQPNSELTFARVTIVVSSCLGNPKYFRHFALRWRHVVAPRPRMSRTSLTLKRLLNQVRTSTMQTAPTRNWSMDFQSTKTRAKFLCKGKWHFGKVSWSNWCVFKERASMNRWSWSMLQRRTFTQRCWPWARALVTLEFGVATRRR